MTATPRPPTSASGPRPRPVGRTRWVTAATAAALTVVLAATTGCGEDRATPATGTAPATADAALEVVIPAGTGTRLAAGEQLDLLPADLEFRVGDVLRIVNRDDRTHVVGPFSVLAGETLTQRFTAPGELAGECTVHPSGTVTLRVLP